jgi:hypothetical protein
VASGLFDSAIYFPWTDHILVIRTITFRCLVGVFGWYYIPSFVIFNISNCDNGLAVVVVGGAGPMDMGAWDVEHWYHHPN